MAELGADYYEALMRDGDVPASIEELYERPRWMALAACRGMGAEAFFLAQGGDARPARRVCALCPVRRPCLEYALADDRMAGMWAGTTERERVRMRRVMREASA